MSDHVIAMRKSTWPSDGKDVSRVSLSEEVASNLRFQE